jgi:hypothetical protein
MLDIKTDITLRIRRLLKKMLPFWRIFILVPDCEMLVGKSYDSIYNISPYQILVQLVFEALKSNSTTATLG